MTLLAPLKIRTLRKPGMCKDSIAFKKNYMFEQICGMVILILSNFRRPCLFSVFVFLVGREIGPVP